MVSLCGCQTPAQCRINIVHSWVQEFYAVLGLGSGGWFQRAIPDSNSVLDRFVSAIVFASHVLFIRG